MVNLDGTKAVSKAAKGTHDRLKALEVAIYNLRSSENDKNWQNVEKCLQVRFFSKFLNMVILVIQDTKREIPFHFNKKRIIIPIDGQTLKLQYE